MHSRLALRYISLFGLLVLALLLILAACGGAPEPTTPDAKDLIRKAQDAIQKVKSYHFNLNADNPGTSGTIVVKSADGDVLLPDKLKTKANVLLLGNAAEVQIITIGDKQYMTDPVTGAWRPVQGLIDPRKLSNPQTGISAILGHIQNPTTPTDSNVDGTPCWSINGQLDAQYLASIIGGAAPAGKQVPVTTCIGKSDNLPYLFRATGVVMQGDSDNTVRTFKLSKYGETITIDPPPGV